MPPALAAFLVQQAAEVRKRVPRPGQCSTDRVGLNAELTAPASVGGQQRGQPDGDGGYEATFTQSTRAKLAGSRDQLSPSSALAYTSPPVVPT